MMKLKVKLEAKSKYFIHNGAILLEKQITLKRGDRKTTEPVKIYSAKEIGKAVNNSDPDSVIGTSFRSTVYRGKLEDLVVAVKASASLQHDEEYIDTALNEVSVGEAIGHRNLVRLYGCCLEVRMPILIYEFMPKGSLFSHLYDGCSRHVITWSQRLNIAADIGYCLSYMHNALPKPIVHRDVQSHNILLDDAYKAKLGYLGYSISITPGDTSEIWEVKGTPGYIDPEYVETQKVTDKSDVYSFGILMIELLTGRHPTHDIPGGIGTALADYLNIYVAQNRLLEILDSRLLLQGGNFISDEIQRFAELALRCVVGRGVERPTMIEVVELLWKVQDTCTGSSVTCQTPATVQS